MSLKNIFNFSNLTLVTALLLSVIAAWYSILGLIAIFAAAVIPIIVMGGALEVAKVVTTVWLHKYWDKVSLRLKFYLVPAVITLAFLTSMGIFGFLSKAHMDQTIVSGDSQAKLSLLDEKIKIQRDNIEAARKALGQMDAQVDQRLSRSDNEQGAERAIQIRRQQLPERNKLLKEINDAQSQIAKLNEERAPIAAENRKIEAEVGPIKYIAALIYGDNPDNNLLERAVRWVIILIVLVFDPLALTLVIASNSSRQWDKTIAEEKLKESMPIAEPIVESKPLETINDDVAAMNIAPPDNVTERKFTDEEIHILDTAPVAAWPTEWEKHIDDANKVSDESIADTVIEEKIYDLEKYPYLNQGFKNPDDWVKVGPMVAKETEESSTVIEEKDVVESTTVEEIIENGPVNVEPTVDSTVSISETEKQISTQELNNTIPYKELEGGYLVYDGKVISKNALQEIKPELFQLTGDNISSTKTNFGTNFPKYSTKGDIFVRVDKLPNRVFKFNGNMWIEINKDASQTYLQNDDYIKFLISKLDAGEYDIELLSENEKEQIKTYLDNLS